MEDGIAVVHVPRVKQLDSCCLIVEIDSLKILVNFGTEHSLSLEIYSNIECIKDVTHILLCSSEITSLGGLLHLQKLGINAPIYGTVPIKILGRIELLERIEVLNKFHLADTSELQPDEAFDRIIPLKYTQTVELSDEITVGPLNSGSSIGGAIWKIRKNEQEWIICDKVNHRKIAHLDGMDISNIYKPSGVIINSTTVNKEQMSRKTRDKTLIDHVLKTVAREGKVFIPTGYLQLLEIVMTLHNYKETRDIPMSLYSFYGKKYFDMVKTILEWTGSSILHKFNQEKENPFNLLSLTFYEECASSQVDGTIIFVIDKYGNSGFSPVILPYIAENPNNLVLKVIDTLQYKEEECKSERLATNSAEEGVSKDKDAEVEAEAEESSIKIKDASSEEESAKKETVCTIQISPIKYSRLSSSEIETEYKKSKKEHDEHEAQKKIDSLVKQKIEDSSEEEEDRSQIFYKFWHELQDEIETKEDQITYMEFDIRCTGSELLFPNPAKRKPTDEYGEPLYIQKEKEVEQEIEVEMEPKEIQKKTFRISVRNEETIKIRARIETLLFSNECDIFNLKVVLSGMDAEKIVVCGENSMYRKILKDYFSYTRASSTVLELSDKQEMAGVRHTVPLKIRNDLLPYIKVQKIGNSLIGYFTGRVEKTEKVASLEIEEELPKKENICIGTVKLSELRQVFIDAKIKADVIDDRLVVNEGIIIYFDGENLVIEGDVSKELYTVKRLLSQSVAYLSTE
ncbi:cleavage and polyadenylation specificity factor subunit 2 [Nematocida minor]|uniref:cleavage and polyadenylation specificity factor subunit 2 n=1 Tax=Nematocida minor TaxID=1912983 RepID=UPI002221275E|nr:cleavage and polyadenylation specificity factor subunit 2 [Nematocida minor]KAI5191310.1 cleavage and polyadenylation specificity factor subunit 2 [Nematocida minor]